MARPRPSNLGFTLVEVLLTLTILSLVMLTGSMAFNFIAQNWQRNQGAYEHSLERYEDFTLLAKVTANIIPKTVLDEDSLAGFYFLGRDNGFTAVSSTSMQDPDYPAVFRLFREREGDVWHLVYEEAVLNNVILQDANQQLPFGFRRVITEGIESVEFEYFGWQDLSTRFEAGDIEREGPEVHQPQWYTDYDGIERRQHPLVVQVLLDGFIWPMVVTDVTSEILNRTMDEEV